MVFHTQKQVLKMFGFTANKGLTLQLGLLFLILIAGCSVASDPDAQTAVTELRTEDASKSAEFFRQFNQELAVSNLEKAAEIAAETGAYAQHNPVPVNRLTAVFMEASLDFLQGRIGLAEQKADALMSETEAEGLQQLFLYASNLAVSVADQQGNTQRGEAILDRVFAEYNPDPYSEIGLKLRRSRAMNYYDRSEYLQAVEMLMQLTAELEAAGNTIMLSDIYADLALIFGQINQHDEAILWHERALRLFYARNNRTGIARTMNNLAIVFDKTEQYGRMADSLQVAVVINRDGDNLLNLARNYYNLGNSYLSRGLYETAAGYFALGLELSEETGSLPGVMFNTFGIGRAYMRQGIQQDTARELFSATLEIAREAGQNAMIMNSLRALYELEKEAGNYSLALEYHEQVLEMQILFQQQAQDAAIQELIIQHNVAQTRSENELLNERLAFQEATSRNRLTIIVLLIIGLVLAVSFFFYALVTRKKLEDAFLDIQNQKVQLEQKNAQLETLGQERDAFLHIIVHDLKNPLSVISSALELLTTNPKDKPVVTLMDDAVKRTGLLIQSLLNVFRMGQLNVMEMLTKVQSSALMNQLRDEYAPIARLKNIELQFRCDAFDFYTHQESFYGILANLLSNAIKYSPRDKTVWAEITRRDSGFEVVIRDQGPGFSEKDHALIFKPFAKLSARPTGSESSTGIGLYSVKTSVTRLNGTITLNSPAEGGAEFVLTFPFLKESEPVAARLS